jgi:acyl-CoA reductase-like NAD-dependent aldehyde dehydrogenase
MSTSTLPVDEVSEVDAIFQSQRAAFRQNPNPDAANRQRHLHDVGRLLVENRDAIAAAISEDFGHRSVHETEVLEIFPALQGAKHAKSHVEAWMQSERKPVSLWFQPGRARVVKQPLGVVGVIVPWNYPLYLALGPLVSALAAGNRVMIKMSEFTPRFGELFASAIGRYFARDHVAVVNGGVDVARAFGAKPFDHLLFTGSTSVARHIMAAAAQNLTPVTLELGGKSPAIVAPDFSIELAAQRIMPGKCLNAGQTCIAPDYALVPDRRLAAFSEAARASVKRLYPHGIACADYSAIINARHYQRLQDYLDDARGKGAEVLPLASGSSELTRKFAPTLVTGVTDDMRIMQEEIFGPLLPVKTYSRLDEAFAYVADHPRPLALYYFDSHSERVNRVLNTTMAGGVTVNDTIFHIAQDDLPFGGVGPSGMGQYHGEDGFNTFSKRKGVFLQSRLNGAWLLMPPFGRRIERMLTFMLRP